jgi:S1-C subfamily serine protease
LLFGKFERIQARGKETLPEPSRPKPPESSGLRLTSALVLMALTAALTYYFTVGGDRQGKSGNPAPAVVEAEADGQTKAHQSPAMAERSPQEVAGNLALLREHPIDYAKNGTVAIETPWGKGSGFFITDIYVVTNKHVVTPDTSHLAEIQHKVETSRRLLNLEQERIAEMRNRIGQLKDGATRQQLEIIVQEREKELGRLLPAQKESEERLKNLEKPSSARDIKIFLADGSEVSADSSQVSPGRDLALLTVFADKKSVLQPAPADRVLQQGDKVYTIGNPVGLRNTVTSGIFSGYRKREGNDDVFLQTDAPINPGNSGGPLIDEHGFVQGINTMVVRDTQGIGFAIPIQTVLEEFSISPAPEPRR